MPSRILDGEIARSESLSKVSRDAGLTFLLLLSVADDHGRFDARPRAVLAALYGMRDDVTVSALGTWLDELERENLIRRYIVADRPYLRLPTWFDYQRRRDSASKWPDPPQELEKDTDSAATCGNLRQPAASCGSRARAPSAEGRIPSAGGRETNKSADAPDGSVAQQPDRRRTKSRRGQRAGPPGDQGPPAPSKRADGEAVLARMAEAQGITAEFLGLPTLDCRWTLPRQKLISAAHRDYPEHGVALGVEILLGFRALAFAWSAEARLAAWSVEALFAPVNVGKRLQARARASPARAEPPQKPHVEPYDFGKAIGANA
jgi:hypothetical protein